MHAEISQRLSERSGVEMPWRWLISSLLVLFGGVTWAADSVEPPRADVVHFPSAFGTPKIHAGTSVDPILSVTDDTLYIVEAEVECIPLCSPAGAVKLIPLSTPVFVLGKFAADPSVIQTKEIKAKFAWRAVPGDKPTATAEIIMVPVGAKSADEVVRRTVSLNNAPQPPPDDGKPKPRPEPDPRPDHLPAKLRITIIRESGDVTAAENAIINAKVMTDRIAEKGHLWRIVDRDATTARGEIPKDIKPLLPLIAGKKLPQVFLIEQDTGKVREQFDLGSDLLARVKAAGG